MFFSSYLFLFQIAKRATTIRNQFCCLVVLIFVGAHLSFLVSSISCVLSPQVHHQSQWAKDQPLLCVYSAAFLFVANSREKNNSERAEKGRRGERERESERERECEKGKSRESASWTHHIQTIQPANIILSTKEIVLIHTQTHARQVVTSSKSFSFPPNLLFSKLTFKSNWLSSFAFFPNQSTFIWMRKCCRNLLGGIRVVRASQRKCISVSSIRTFINTNGTKWRKKLFIHCNKFWA